MPRKAKSTVQTNGKHTAQAPAKPEPKRAARRCWSYPEGDYAVIQIASGGTTWCYFVRRMQKGLYVLEKLEREGKSTLYTCCISAERSFCTCDGFKHRGECKHYSALASLIEAGKL